MRTRTASELPEREEEKESIYGLFCFLLMFFCILFCSIAFPHLRELCMSCDWLFIDRRLACHFFHNSSKPIRDAC